MSLQVWLCAHGHLAYTADLARAGFSRYARADAPGVERLKRGVYACAHLDEGLRSAGRAGCLVDCTTALRRHGVWSGVEERGCHWRARPHHHVDPQPGVGDKGVVLHWSTSSLRSKYPLEVEPVSALLQMLSCLEPYDALASLESAVHVGYIDDLELRQVILYAPLRLKAVLARFDSGGQSGFETHTRLMLADAGHSVRTQFHVPGAGALDLLVDDCVGVETDGREWHGDERFLRDRTKDLGVANWGIPVVRIARPHIFDSWHVTLNAIEALIAQSRRAQKRR